MPRGLSGSIQDSEKPRRANEAAVRAKCGKNRRRRRTLRPPERPEVKKGAAQDDLQNGNNSDLLSQKLGRKGLQERDRDPSGPAAKRPCLNTETSPQGTRTNVGSVTDNSPSMALKICTPGRQAGCLAALNSRPDASNITFSKLPGDSELLLEELRNRGSRSEWRSNSNRSCTESKVVKRLTFALNDMKEKLATERDLKVALVRVNKSSDEKIVELEKQVLHWKRKYDYHVQNALENRSKSIKAPESQKNKSKSEPKSEQMPLWLYVTSRMRTFCLIHLNCQRKERDGIFRRDWDCCSIQFPSFSSKELSAESQNMEGEEDGQEDLGDWIVSLSNGRKGVPRCPMERALMGGFLDKELNLGSFQNHLVAAYGSEEMLRKDCPEFERFEKIAKEVAEARFPEYKVKLGNAISARKKDAVDGLLRDLGYPVLNDINKKVHDYERKRAKAEEQVLRAIEKLLLTREDSSGTEWPIFDTYRTASFDSLSNIGVNVKEGQPPSFIKGVAVNEMTDILFKNNAARNAFVSWIRFSGEGTSSVLDLARIDAWICTWLELTRKILRRKDSRKPGGSRNKEFNKRFNKLLPKALEEILLTCRLELEKVCPNDLRKPFDLDARTECMEAGDVSIYDNAASYDIEVRPEVHKGDIYNRNGRRYTKAFNCPENDMDYVALKSSFFKSHICSWIGDIIDCYVGRCDHDEMTYSPITANNTSMLLDYYDREDAEENGTS